MRAKHQLAILTALLLAGCGVKSRPIPKLTDVDAIQAILMQLSDVPPGQSSSAEASPNREGWPGSDRNIFIRWINRQYGDASVHMRDPTYWGSSATTVGAAIKEERAAEAAEANGPSIEELNAIRRAKASADLERDAPQAHGMGTIAN
jgi:hypothetical protein